MNEKKSLRANWHADGDSWDQTQLLDAALQAISMSEALSLVGRLEKDEYIRELGNEAADTALANALERLQ